MIPKFILFIIFFLLNFHYNERYTVITNLTSCDYYYHAKTNYGIYDVKIPSKFELLVTMNDNAPLRIILEVRDSCIPECDTIGMHFKNLYGVYRIEGTDGDTYQDLILESSLRQYFILPPSCQKI